MSLQKRTHPLHFVSPVLVQIGLAVLGAGASLALTGFVLGKGFDLVHLPLVAELYRQPQFAHDVFIQSLRSFPSGFWRLLEGASSWADVPLLFLGLAFLSRFVCFSGLLFCASRLGLEETKDKALFVLTSALMPLLYRAAVGNQNGLFSNAVSQTELACGLSLFALGFMARNKAGLAVFTAALAFFVTPFIGLWLALPLFLMAAFALKEGAFAEEKSFRNLILGGLAALPLVAPTVLSLHRDRYYGDVFGFDYSAFLRAFRPEAFLFANHFAGAYLVAGFVLIAGFVFFLALAKQARPFLIAYIGYALLLFAGFLLPHLTHTPQLLNLHLFQTTRFLALLTTLGVGVWLTHFVCRKSTPARKAIYLLLLIAFALPTGFGAQKAWQAPEKGWIEEWKEISRWAHTETSPRSLFLPPVIPPTTASNPSMGAPVFEYESRRRVWVDFAHGVAVLWRQPYYKIWEPRIRAVLSLKTLKARLAYAHRRGIDYVIDLCAKEAPAPVFQTKRLCVYGTREN